MNGKKAKAVRRKVYGDQVTSSHGRKYFVNRATGQISADKLRRVYQRIKKEYNNGKIEL